jgi:polyketide synthase 12/myxalamid-type polyketide synthase MxaB
MGKIVLRVAERAALTFRPDASYLITGGLNGLGLEVARWMVEKGARELVLMGRSKASAAADEVITAMRRAGASVSVAQGDVSCPEDVASALAMTSLPLRGIIHSAGVLSDGVLLQQTPEKFATVMAPKVQGAWNLHQQTLASPLDFFVLFSSAASLLGSPGQSNHAAANAFLDMLAYRRRAEQRPALSINWGAWDKIGAAANRQATKQARMAGVGVMQPEEGLWALERLMTGSAVQAGVIPIDWPAFARQLPGGARPPFLAEFLNTDSRFGPAESSKADQAGALNRIRNAPPSEQLTLLSDFVRERAKQVLGVDASRDIDPRQPLNELGLDSLMAVELRNALGMAAGRALPFTMLFDYPTLEALTGYLATVVLQLTPAAENPRPAEPVELEELSEDDMAALLSQELAALRRKRASV